MTPKRSPLALVIGTQSPDLRGLELRQSCPQSEILIQQSQCDARMSRSQGARLNPEVLGLVFGALELGEKSRLDVAVPLGITEPVIVRHSKAYQKSRS